MSTATLSSASSETITTQTLGQLFEALQGPAEPTLLGDAHYTVSRLVHPLEARQPDDMIFALAPEALQALAVTPAKTALIPEDLPLPPDFVPNVAHGIIRVKRPRVALAILLKLFDQPLHAPAGLHPSAVIDPTAQVDPAARIGALVYVGPGAKIGAQTVIMPNSTIGAHAKIGEQCILHAGVRVGERVIIGNRVILQHNVSLGADGFSYVTPEAGSIESARASGGKIDAQNADILRINSAGTVILEDDVEVGANAAIDRATLGATLIKRGTKIDNLVMIGHNNTVGENCLIVSQVGISGSCKIGNRVVLAGQAGIKDHTTIGDDAIIMAKSGVMQDVPTKTIVAGIPAMPQREAFQNIAYLAKVKDLHREVLALKRQLADIQAQLSPAAPPAET